MRNLTSDSGFSREKSPGHAPCSHALIPVLFFFVGKKEKGDVIDWRNNAVLLWLFVLKVARRSLKIYLGGKRDSSVAKETDSYVTSGDFSRNRNPEGE